MQIWASHCFIDCKYSAALEVNPSRAVWAVPDNYSTISSFNHMLMSCITHHSTKTIISGVFPLRLLYGFALMMKLFCCQFLWAFAPIYRISGHNLNQTKQHFSTQRTNSLDFSSSTVPPSITRQLGVNPSSVWARGRIRGERKLHVGSRAKIKPRTLLLWSDGAKTKPSV